MRLENKTIDFYCYQPLHIINDLFIKFINNELESQHKSWQKLDTTFIKSFSRKYNLKIEMLTDICCRSCWEMFIWDTNPSIFNYALTDEYELWINIFDKKLTEHILINHDSSGFVLLFDKINRTYVIIYKVSFLINNDTFLTDYINSETSNNIYYNFRDNIVIDKPREIINLSKWSTLIRNECLHQSANNIGYLLNIKSKKHCKISIDDNTGYCLINFVNFRKELNSINEEQLLKLSNKLLSNNREEELAVKQSFFENEPKNSIVYFGWRFTTLLGIGNKHSVKCLSFMLHMQIIYILINKFFKVHIKEAYQDIRFKKSYNLNKNLKQFDLLVLSLRSLIHEKRTISKDYKPIYRDIYEHVEEYWGLKNDYRTLNRSIEIIKESIERRLSNKININNQIQADILFFLAIIQILSIATIAVDINKLLNLKVSDINPDYLFVIKFLQSKLFVIMSSISGFMIIVAYHIRTLNYITSLLYKLKNFITIKR